MTVIAWRMPPAGKFIVVETPNDQQAALAEASRDNLEKLIPLLKDRDESSLMLADVYRQLSRFDEGAEQARSAAQPDSAWAAVQIQVLCEQGVSEPRYLDFPEP